MGLLIFVPILICAYFVLRGRSEKALLAVYLPTVFWLPQAYFFHIPHLPPLSVSEGTVVPLGIFAFCRFLVRRRFVLMDLLVASFMASLALSEVLREHVLNDGIFIAIVNTLSIVLPYLIGRTMIEPELRLVTVKRILSLVLFLGLPGLFEWRFGHNLYAPLGRIVGIDMAGTIQMRGGRGRFSAAFTDAEIAGIAIGMTAALNAWVAFLVKRRPLQTLGSLFSQIERRHVAGILLFVYVVLTQSRGPLLALFVGYSILQIPRFKNTRLASAVVAVLLLVGTVAGYLYFARQASNVNPYAVVDELQGSTAYRFRMNQLYQPIAEEGGWLGWSVLSFPSLPGMLSIDNEFLLIRLSQGLLGYILFLLIAAESVRGLLVRSWRFDDPEERAFVISMLAAMAIVWFSVATVYMGEQLPQIVFLFIGWGQSIAVRDSPTTATREPEARTRFQFRRVLQ